MLPHEKQICSLELSKKLEKLGVKQDSLWWWEDTKGQYGPYHTDCVTRQSYIPIYSALTVAELVLPQGFYSGRTATGFAVQLLNAWDRSWGLDNRDIWKISKSDTEANARAKMLIYLIENKLIKAEDL